MDPIRISKFSGILIDFLENTKPSIRIDEKIAALQAAAEAYRAIVSVESTTAMLSNMLSGKFLPEK